MKTTDVELIYRVLDGDDTAFTVLVKKYHKPVHALVWRKIGDFHIAEEITQDTFLKAYQELATLKKPQSFASWLYVIAANNCSTWLRKRRLSTEPFEDARLQEATYSGYVVAENERTEAEAQREVVKKLLAKLQESDRTVITLHYFGEMSSAEIGAFLGVSANTVRSRLRRAQQRLKREEPMIREALENFQITPNLTENIMREVSRLKPTAPSGGKPLVPWAMGVSVLAVVFLIFGIANHQSLSRFQKPYSFNAASELKVELIDAPVVLNLEAEPDNRTQLGNANAQDKSNGVGNQVDDTAPFDLETIIRKIKHYDNAVTSVTGDFIMERQSGLGISKREYTLTFAGEKVRMDQEQDHTRVQLWDGKRHWEAREDRRMIFEFEIAPGKEKTDIETIRQAFKHNGIDLADDVRIVDDDEPQDFTLIENETDQKYYFWLEGETTLLVYDLNHLQYDVRPGWTGSADNDPRFWLTFRPASNNSYLSEPLWYLLEQHESEIIGNEILNGDKTSVIRLNIPAQSKGDFKRPAQSVKLWISHDKGFRLVKLEESAYTIDNRSAGLGFKAGVTYISSREIAYHEYLPDVWFPERIEISIAPVSSPDQQEKGEPVLKKVLLTKQCRLNTDVTGLLDLGLPLDTSIFDYGTGKPSTVGDVLNPVSKPDIRKLFGSSAMPVKSDGSDQHTYNPSVFDLEAIITQMKHADSSVVSASGNFVIEHHRKPGIAKTEYALTFEGDGIRVERGWGSPLAVKDYPRLKKVFPSVELDDGERRWEIYKYKKHLFSVEITLDKKQTALETIRQAFKQQEIALADDVRIVASEEPESYTLIENQTGKTYFILWEGETTLKVYDLQHTEYGIRDPFRRKVSDRRFESPLRYQWNMLADLDPRYWLTYPSAGGRTYLTEPLWQLLEKHESELLGSEVLNGDETSVIRLKLPDESLIIWISHEKGFRPVKLQRAFPLENHPVDIIAMKYFQSGVNYIETREIDYREYLPDVWFPKKIERYFTPIAAADLPHVAEIILKTVIHTKQCRLNTDVAELLRLNLSPDTPVLGLKPDDDTPIAEKVAYLRQEIPRILKHRLDLEKLDDEIAESYGEDPDLTLLRDQAADEAFALKGTISLLTLDYIRFAADSSALKPGGDFYELLEKNGIFYDFE